MAARLQEAEPQSQDSQAQDSESEFVVDDRSVLAGWVTFLDQASRVFDTGLSLKEHVRGGIGFKLQSLVQMFLLSRRRPQEGKL